MVSTSGCVGWLKKRTNLEKTLLSLSSILLVTLLLMILIGIAFKGKKSSAMSDEDTCWSSECIKTAGDVISSMDPTINSCENLYDFACGKYGQEPGQTVSVSRRSTESVYFSLKRVMESAEKSEINGLDDIKSFYNSCVNFGSYRQDVKATGETLLKLMSEIGVGIWPIIDPLYDVSVFSLEVTLASLILLDVPVVFRMEVIPDENLADFYLLKISPGGPHESGRSPDQIRSDVHLSSSVLTSLLLLGASSVNSDASDLLSVDSSFAAIEQDTLTICDDVTLLSPQEATTELKRLMPEIQWEIIMSEIRKATGLMRPLAVELHCKQKIRDYAVHLSDLSLRSVANYLGWRFFSKFTEHIIPTFEKSQFDSDEVVSRWRVCLELMEKFASPIFADVLTRTIINKDIQDEVMKISSAALTSAQRLLSRARWLNDSQRSRIQEKVSRINVRYPFQKKTDSELPSVFIPQVDVSNFTAVVINRQRQWVIQRFRRLSNEMESSKFTESWTPLLTAREDTPSPDFLTAFIYFDKIRSPFIRLHGPKWMNYGAFGVAVAREISKVLMIINAGSSHEEKTPLWNVWSRSRNSSMCLVKSLVTKLGITEEALPPGVTETLMKDIFLDHSSIEIAFETASSMAAESKSHSVPGLELSNEKMFFLSYAQTLCEADTPALMSKYIPAKDRLNTAVLNFDTFNKVFDCAPLSSQCQIWA